MKIGIATYNGKMISKHFGRSKYFVITEIENGNIIGSETRENSFTAHAQGQCAGDDNNHQSHHGPGHGHHSHDGIVAALHDCDAVLCYGMGWRAAQDLKAAGIKACILTEKYSVEEAVKAYIKGEVNESEEFFCGCQSGTKKLSE